MVLQAGAGAAAVQESTSGQTVKHASLFDCLQGDVIDLTEDCGQSITGLDEYKKFLQEPVTIANPLQWWASNEKRFVNPTLIINISFEKLNLTK